MFISVAAWLQGMLFAATDWAVSQRGQGTVEYVGVVVMVTLLIAAVAAASKGWAPDVGKELKKAVTASIKKATGGL